MSERNYWIGVVSKDHVAIGVAGGFKTAHLVPGLEYKINDKIDVLAEAGVALNDNSRHYVSGGIAIYFR